MILVLADSTDPWAILVHRELCGRGEKVSWIRPAQILDRILVNWQVTPDAAGVRGNLIIDECPVSLSDLTGIFLRCTFPLQIELDDALSPEDRNYILKESTAAWLALLHAIPCAVVNRPIPGGRPTLLAGSPRIAELSQQYGFSLPVSRCTSSRADAILQFSAWGERAYLKPLGSHEPGTALLPQDGVEQICGVIEQQAVSMQAMPAGQRITVYVAGDEATGTILQCSDAPGRMTGVPSLPTQQCVNLVRALGLTFAECQIIVTPDGHNYCLDVSSAPAFWRCPKEIQQQIVRHLANYLSERRSLPLHGSFDGGDGRPGARERLR
ncbi:MAG TPA: hypothetical protein VIU63_02120 [Nitrospira sp.]